MSETTSGNLKFLLSGENEGSIRICGSALFVFQALRFLSDRNIDFRCFYLLLIAITTPAITTIAIIAPMIAYISVLDILDGFDTAFRLMVRFFVLP